MAAALSHLVLLTLSQPAKVALMVVRVSATLAPAALQVPQSTVQPPTSTALRVVVVLVDTVVVPVVQEEDYLVASGSGWAVDTLAALAIW